MSDVKPPLAGPHDSLDRAVDERMILDLHAAGLLNTAARDAAIASLQPALHWWRWANRSLLFVGSALVLAGVIFFFAHNWARMPAVAKFCLIETGLWICAVGAWQRGLEKIGGKVLLLAASVLVGVLLAVYGQVYQTGADAYENFVMWAALIVLWVVTARFAALWMLWLVVTNVALILFWLQVDPPADFDFYFGIFLLLAIWNGLVLAGREHGASRGLDWLAGTWTRHVIWCSILVYLTIPTIALVLEMDFGHGELVGALGLTVALVAGQLYFRRLSPDLFAVAMNVLAICFVFLTLVGRILFDLSEGALAFLAFGVLVLGISSVAAFYLRHTARIMGDDGNQ